MDTTSILNEMVVPIIESFSIINFIFSLIIAAILASGVKTLYIRYGRSLSNRSEFAQIFTTLTMTTLLIITVVQSSLALSLGLIGALSIVRFRAAIKEPEELAYLFLCIAIGLGLGAGQNIITITAFVIISGAIYLKNVSYNKNDKSPLKQNLYLTIKTKEKSKLELDKMIAILSSFCSKNILKRYDVTDYFNEACFIIEFDKIESLQTIEKSLRNEDKSVNVTYLDNRFGLIDTI